MNMQKDPNLTTREGYACGSLVDVSDVDGKGLYEGQASLALVDGGDDQVEAWVILIIQARHRCHLKNEVAFPLVSKTEARIIL
jgi:hypothetical protein